MTDVWVPYDSLPKCSPHFRDECQQVEILFEELIWFKRFHELEERYKGTRRTGKEGEPPLMPVREKVVQDVLFLKQRNVVQVTFYDADVAEEAVDFGDGRYLGAQFDVNDEFCGVYLRCFLAPGDDDPWEPRSESESEVEDPKPRWAIHRPPRLGPPECVVTYANLRHGTFLGDEVYSDPNLKFEPDEWKVKRVLYENTENIDLEEVERVLQGGAPADTTRTGGAGGAASDDEDYAPPEEEESEQDDANSEDGGLLDDEEQEEEDGAPENVGGNRSGRNDGGRNEEASSEVDEHEEEDDAASGVVGGARARGSDKKTRARGKQAQTETTGGRAPTVAGRTSKSNAGTTTSNPRTVKMNTAAPPSGPPPQSPSEEDADDGNSTSLSVSDVSEEDEEEIKVGTQGSKGRTSKVPAATAHAMEQQTGGRGRKLASSAKAALPARKRSKDTSERGDNINTTTSSSKQPMKQTKESLFAVWRPYLERQPGDACTHAWYWERSDPITHQLTYELARKKNGSRINYKPKSSAIAKRAAADAAAAAARKNMTHKGDHGGAAAGSWGTKGKGGAGNANGSTEQSGVPMLEEEIWNGELERWDKRYVPASTPAGKGTMLSKEKGAASSMTKGAAGGAPGAKQGLPWPPEEVQPAAEEEDYSAKIAELKGTTEKLRTEITSSKLLGVGEMVIDILRKNLEKLEQELADLLAKQAAAQAAAIMARASNPAAGWGGEPTSKRKNNMKMKSKKMGKGITPAWGPGSNRTTSATSSAAGAADAVARGNAAGAPSSKNLAAVPPLSEGLGNGEKTDRATATSKAKGGKPPKTAGGGCGNQKEQKQMKGGAAPEEEQVEVRRVGTTSRAARQEQEEARPRPLGTVAIVIENAIGGGPGPQAGVGAGIAGREATKEAEVAGRRTRILNEDGEGEREKGAATESGEGRQGLLRHRLYSKGAVRASSLLALRSGAMSVPAVDLQQQTSEGATPEGTENPVTTTTCFIPEKDRARLFREWKTSCYRRGEREGQMPTLRLQTAVMALSAACASEDDGADHIMGPQQEKEHVAQPQTSRSSSPPTSSSATTRRVLSVSDGAHLQHLSQFLRNHNEQDCDGFSLEKLDLSDNPDLTDQTLRNLLDCFVAAKKWIRLIDVSHCPMLFSISPLDDYLAQTALLPQVHCTHTGIAAPKFKCEELFAQLLEKERKRTDAVEQLAALHVEGSVTGEAENQSGAGEGSGAKNGPSTTTTTAITSKTSATTRLRLTQAASAVPFTLTSLPPHPAEDSSQNKVFFELGVALLRAEPREDDAKDKEKMSAAQKNSGTMGSKQLPLELPTTHAFPPEWRTLPGDATSSSCSADIAPSSSTIANTHPMVLRTATLLVLICSINYVTGKVKGNNGLQRRDRLEVERTADKQKKIDGWRLKEIVNYHTNTDASGLITMFKSKQEVARLGDVAIQNRRLALAAQAVFQQWKAVQNTLKVTQREAAEWILQRSDEK
eukprot:g1278.t1